MTELQCGDLHLFLSHRILWIYHHVPAIDWTVPNSPRCDVKSCSSPTLVRFVYTSILLNCPELRIPDMWHHSSSSPSSCSSCSSWTHNNNNMCCTDSHHCRTHHTDPSVVFYYPFIGGWDPRILLLPRHFRTFLKLCGFWWFNRSGDGRTNSWHKS